MSKNFSLFETLPPKSTKKGGHYARQFSSPIFRPVLHIQFSSLRLPTLHVPIFPPVFPNHFVRAYKKRPDNSSKVNYQIENYASGILLYSIFVDNIVHILISPAGKINKNRTFPHLPRQFHTISNCMRAFDCRNNAFHT